MVRAFKMAHNNLDPLEGIALCSPLPHCLELSHAINRILWKRWCVSFKARSDKTLWLHLDLSWITHPGEASHRIGRIFRLQMMRNWGLLLSAMWVIQIRSGSSSSSQTFKWERRLLTSWLYLHIRPWHRNTWLVIPKVLTHRNYMK